MGYNVRHKFQTKEKKKKTSWKHLHKLKVFHLTRVRTLSLQQKTNFVLIHLGKLKKKKKKKKKNCKKKKKKKKCLLRKDNTDLPTK